MRLERGLALVSIMLFGCAGGMPLLHPAHTLHAGDVRAIGGVSGQVAVGNLSADLNSSYDQSVKDPNAPTNPAYVKGVLVAASVAPGIAPIVGARVGVGAGAEGGVAYTGRGARLDLREAFGNRSVALSIGAGFDAVFLGRQGNAPLSGVDLNSLEAFGFDVPVIVGWRSTASLYQVWGGVRGGYDHASIATRTTAPTDLPSAGLGLSADHGYIGGLLGMAVGLRHIHVALELDVAYHFITGTFAGNQASTNGVTFTPGSALLVDF